MPKKKEEMTPEELLKYAEELEKNQSEQNKYITKLEQGGKKTDPEMKAYFQGLRMKDLKEAAEKELVKLYGEAVFNAVKPQFDEWCKVNANPEHITKSSFFVSAFKMAIGEVMSQKDHPIYKILGVPEVKPQETDDPEVVKIVDQVGNPVPSPINENDPASLTPGGDHEPMTGHANTDEAMKELGVLIANADINPYES